MTSLAVVLCLAIAALGAIGVVAPPTLLGIVRRLQSPAGIWFAAGIRVVLGVALLLAAPGAKAPMLVRGLGVFVVFVGLVTPLFGVERFGRLLDWWSSQGDVFIRLWAIIAVAVGVGLAWLVLPPGAGPG